MIKHNLLIKKIKRQILSINDLIESNFNKLKYLKSNYKKVLLSKDNRLILVVVIAAILTLFYFLIPTIYNKEVIQSQIENQIYKNYKIKIKFNKKLDYGLLPKPHFSVKNLSIFHNKREIGVTKNLKVFIGLSDFFLIDKINIKNLAFNNTDFNIKFEDLSFFQNLLVTEPNQNNIIFNESNIFFKNENDEVLFINKIKNSQFYYDFINFQNILTSKNEIFTIPYKVFVKNDKFNKKIYTKFDSKKIRLKINNEINYDEQIKNGNLDILFFNKSTSINYKIDQKSLSFFSKDMRNKYEGLIDFKPFYFSATLNYDGISTKNFFKDNSIFIELINSGIFNNKNLSGNLNLKVKDITNINELNNLNLKISIEEGELNFSNSSIMWKDNLIITFDESIINSNDDGINLLGTIVIDFIDINKFYSSFQIQKKIRKDIKQLKLDFVYNLNSKMLRFDNAKIDNSENLEIEEFLDNFNSEDERKFNRITFKNFINNFFVTYSG